MYVCICHGVSDRTIRQLAQSGKASSLRELREQTGAMTSCGKCARCVRDVFQENQTPSPRQYFTLHPMPA